MHAATSDVRSPFRSLFWTVKQAAARIKLGQRVCPLLCGPEVFLGTTSGLRGCRLPAHQAADNMQSLLKLKLLHQLA